MNRPRFDTYDHMTHTAYTWLADVAEALGTDDRRFAYRMLRAWLHTVRDRLTAENAAQFAAQLPELIRGVYYEGWSPGRVPMKYDADGFVARFAREARVSPADVPSKSGAVATALRRHLSAGQLDAALAQLPTPVRDLAAGPPETAGERGRGGVDEDRLVRIERQVAVLTDAVRALAQGLEDVPVAAPDERRGARAARLAHEMLMTPKG